MLPPIPQRWLPKVDIRVLLLRHEDRHLSEGLRERVLAQQEPLQEGQEVHGAVRDEEGEPRTLLQLNRSAQPLPFEKLVEL